MVERILRLAQELSDLRQQGFDVSEYSADVISYLDNFPAEAADAIERLRAGTVFPTGELAPREFVFKDQELFENTRALDRVYTALVTYEGLVELYDIESDLEPGFLEAQIAESAEARSVFLELARQDASHLRAAVTTIPDDTELTQWLSAAEARVQLAAGALQDIIDVMNEADLPSRMYRRQVLTVTGEITTDILDVGIVASLVSEWSDIVISYLADEGPRWVFRLILVALIILVFFQLSKLVQKGVERAMNSSRNRMSYLLRRMITSSVRNLVMFLGVLIAISQLGISLAPLLAGLGIAGFIIGFALQDSLSNFASGIMILMYRPFDVGDVVDAAGVRGRVSSMSLVNTTFMTLDNQRLVVPNNMIWQSVITNVTAQRTRRVDLLFGISYGDDIEKAEKVLWDILKENEAVLDDPEPIVKVHELGESSVNFAVRPWVKTTDYWDTYWDLTREVKLRFDKEGISIPFPQRDVHLFEQKST
jgi:small conductance mechanosensitive channel